MGGRAGPLRAGAEARPAARLPVAAAADCVVKVRLADEYRPAVPASRSRRVSTALREIAPGMGEFVFRTEAPARFLAGQFAHPAPARASRARAPIRCRTCRTKRANGASSFAGARRPRQQRDVRPLASATRWPSTGPTAGPICASDNARDVGLRRGRLRASARSPRSPARRCSGRRAAHPRVRGRANGSRPLLPGARSRERAVARLCARPLGRAEGSGWAGARGFIHAHVEAHAFPVEGTEFYFAGPPPMVEAMNELLVMRWRAPLAQIHTDKFF